MSSELCFLSIAQASDLMRRRKLSPLELTEAHLSRIDALDGALGSFITVTREEALREARDATSRRPPAAGPLFGIPVTLKDNIATAGVRTTAASRVLKDWVPERDASLVTRLRAAGAVLLGKVALSEFTFAGGSTGDDFVKAPRNPWNLERSAGGSSNGSAVGVAAGLAMASVGSDSGGSIRIPAAFCGVTGLKPTYGRIGRSGVIPLSYSMDTMGPIAREVRDTALVLEVLAGFDPADATTSRLPVPHYGGATSKPVRGLRIATCPDYVEAVGLESDVEEAIAGAVEVFRFLGASIREASVPHLTYACAAGYNTIMRIEAFEYHFPNLRDRRGQYGAAFRNIARGGFLTARDYLRAQKARTLICGELHQAFEQVDALILPVTPATPGGGSYGNEGTDAKVRKGSFAHGAAYTAPFNLTGSPVLALPCGFTKDGMPIGLQLVGRSFQEETLIAAGHQYHARTRLAPLRIRGVEGIVIRVPHDTVAENDVVELAPPGSTTPGRGLWNRLDHASPTRQRGYEQATLVKITTDEGLVGWGECHAPSAPHVHQRIISDLLAPLLVGRDARQVEALWERMYTSERVRGYSTGSHLEAMAGVDLALWDLLGKWANVPVYQLLGGRYRAEISTYATLSGTYTGRHAGQNAADRANAMVDAGFRVLKMALRTGPDSAEFALVREISSAVAPRAQLAVDALGTFTLAEATRMGRELDRLGQIAWFEDPLLPEEMLHYPHLTRTVDTAICAGEALSNRFQFRDLLAARGVDIVNPDICRCGGITEARRIAWLADIFGVIWTPHVSTGTAPYMAASIHMAVSSPNAVMMEVYDGYKHDGPLGNVLLREPLDMKPGVARVPERPGLGVDFDEAALARVIVSGNR
ncbi:MAG: hypothetical protein HYU53_00930 [Acidobacteria bacterium]|nr:hypothetical protein [Acidobacteriota bacterium]